VRGGVESEEVVIKILTVLRVLLLAIGFGSVGYAIYLLTIYRWFGPCSNDPFCREQASSGALLYVLPMFLCVSLSRVIGKLIP
jgi:hypothetical protein